MDTSPQQKALDQLLELAGDAGTGTPFDEARARVLALQWPSLAAALANLLAAHGMCVPRPWRTAANIMRGEIDCEDVAQIAADERTRSGSVRWCSCRLADYPHQHDGTMPGNPVIK